MRSENDPAVQLIFGSGLAYGAVMDKTLLGKIVGALGEDEANVDIFLSGVTGASNLAMSTAMVREMAITAESGSLLLRGQSLPLVEDTVMTAAGLLGWSIQSAYEGLKSKEEMAAQQAEAFAAVVGAATSLPFIPSVKPEMLQWAIDQGKDQALSVPQRILVLNGQVGLESHVLLRDHNLGLADVMRSRRGAVPAESIGSR